MKKASELWKYVSMRGLKPTPKTSVSTWADNYRVLSSTSAEPGRWRTSRAPYQKDIMDAFTQPGIHRVVVKSCAQVGKSDIMNNVIGRFAHLDGIKAGAVFRRQLDAAQVGEGFFHLHTPHLPLVYSFGCR